MSKQTTPLQDMNTPVESQHANHDTYQSPNVSSPDVSPAPEESVAQLDESTVTTKNEGDVVASTDGATKRAETQSPDTAQPSPTPLSAAASATSAPLGVFGNNLKDARVTVSDGERIRRLELRINQLLEEQQLQALRQRYGEDAVDPNVIRATAQQYGLTDFVAAFKIANFDKAAQFAVDQYVQGKAQQSQVSVQGGGATPSSVPPQPPKTMEEARRAAAAYIAQAQRKHA